MGIGCARPAGEGRATRAVRLAFEWALRELRIAGLQLRTDPENLPSQRVTERSGFVKEGALRSFLEYKGGRSDAVFFSLLPTDIANTSSQRARASAIERSISR